MELQQYWLILRRRWLPALGVCGVILALVALVTFMQKPVYEAEGQLLFKQSNSASSLTGLGQNLGELSALGRLSNPIDTESVVVRSTPLIQKVIQQEKLATDEGEALTPQDFLDKLAVQNLRGTDVLSLVYKDTDPQRAAQVVNALMKVYLDNNILVNRAEAVAARAFIEQQLPKVEANVRNAEINLRKFEEEQQVINLEEEARASVAVMTDLEGQIAKAKAALGESSAQAKELRREVGVDTPQAVALSTLSQSTAVQKVLEELQTAEALLAVERTRYQDNYPTVVNLKRKRDALATLLKQRVNEVVGDRVMARQIQKNLTGPQAKLQLGALKESLVAELVASEVRSLGLASQVDVLQDVQQGYKERAQVLPKLKQRQGDLMRQLKASQSTYEILLQKLQEVRVAENQNVGNARIIAPAVLPEEPVGPRKLLNLSGGLLLGALLGLITALVLDRRDRSVKTVKELREIFSYTLLGAIPSYDEIRDSKQMGTKRLVVRDAPRSAFSEAYRILLANLKFLSSDKDNKVIVVTSSVPSEGKSTVSANLALVIAELGNRVLLVDADMRRPSQQQIWEVPNNIGLSNVLVGKNSLKEAIREQGENLYILTAGVLPPNPVALIDSQRMTKLIKDFAQEYDYVIIDCPPIAVAADAPILGRMADGVLFVTRPGVVDSASAASAKEFMDRSGINILGQVINGVIPENESDSYYYYSQSYYSEDGSKVEKKPSKKPFSSSK